MSGMLSVLRPSVEVWTSWVAPTVTSRRHVINHAGACHMPHNPQRCSSVATNLHESSPERILQTRPRWWLYPFIASKKTETAPHKRFWSMKNKFKTCWRSNSNNYLIMWKSIDCSINTKLQTIWYAAHGFA
jgi:hypothetical protein